MAETVTLTLPVYRCSSCNDPLPTDHHYHGRGHAGFEAGPYCSRACAESDAVGPAFRRGYHIRRIPRPWAPE